MPKISKVRITGVKYDNFRKGYEDTILDFTRNDEPDHTLMTLVNQGGKGVLMQLLSQITMPDTRWGKESGNRIISMFMIDINFVPYTFHVYRVEAIQARKMAYNGYMCNSCKEKYNR